MTERRVAAGYGLAVLVVGAVVLVLGFVAVIAGVFFLRSSSEGVRIDVNEPGEVEHEYSAVFDGVDGSTTELWASVGDNCIGATVDGEEVGVCHSDGPVIDQIVVGGQRWYVALA